MRTRRVARTCCVLRFVFSLRLVRAAIVLFACQLLLPPNGESAEMRKWKVQVERSSDLRIAAHPRPIVIGQDFAVRYITPATPSRFLAGCRQTDKLLCDIWDFGQGVKVASLGNLSDPVRLYALSPDGAWFALSPLKGGTIQLWSSNTGKLEREIKLKQERPSLNYLAFAQPDRLVAGLGVENKFQVFDCASGEEACSFSVDFSVMASCATISNAGNYLAISNQDDQSIRFFDLRQGEPAGRLTLPTLENQAKTIGGIHFSPDGTEFAVMVTSLKGGAIVCWNVNDGSHVLTMILEKSPSLLVNNGNAYQGESLEFVANIGWLAYGRGFIDRKLQKPVWSEARTTFSPPDLVRRVLPDGRLLLPTGRGSTTAYVVDELPWTEIRAGSAVVANGGTSSDAGLPAITTANWNGVKNISHSGREAWAEQAIPAPVAAATFRGKPIKLEHSAFLVQRIAMSSPEARRAMVSAMIQKESSLATSNGQFPQQATVLDLEKAAPIRTLKPAFPTDFLDMAPGGNRIVSRSGREYDRVDVWDADSGDHVLAFRPFEADSFPVKLVTAAWLLDDKRMLTFGSNGKLTSWSLPKCEAVYSLDMVASPNAFLNPPVCLDSRRTRFAAVSIPSVRMVNAADGQCLGTFDSPMDFDDGGTCIRLAFSPDDSQLAMTWRRAGEERLAVWDTSKGKLVRDVVLDAGGSELIWAAPEQLLIENYRKSQGRTRLDAVDPRGRTADLFDVKRGFVTWRYVVPLGRMAGWGPGNCAWYVTSESPTANGIFYPLALPTEESAAAMNKIPEPQAALTKGSQLGLSIQMKLREGSPSSEPQEKEVRGILEKQITLSGMQIVDRALFALRVQIDEGWNSDLMKLFQLGELDRAPIVKELSWHCQLTLTDAAGKSYWKRARLFTVAKPTMGRADERELFSQNSRKEQWKKVTDWLAKEPFPQEIADSKDRQAIGESALGARGEEGIHSLR